ncbi:MAG TPA: 1,4-alpha-glucan branching protein domain-containing protein [Gemmatimonadales bacterium]|nr:1,4-alpha-glucan branching protein domain-containing protein [Gemmatimonadales bacterium]
MPRSATRPMDFVLALHSHLPYVLNHGRWPHGSDWLCEAALETYLPLLETLRALEADRVAAPVTIGFTPVLANQLLHPTFAAELDAFFVQRLVACDEAPASLSATGEGYLLPLVSWWRDRLVRMRELWEAIGRDIIGAFRALEEAGRLEIIGSAATHGFLPLLARDESIRLQLALGFAEHRRIFGREPRGCWVPECAYRPRGEWHPWPSAPKAAVRRGTDEHVADAGFRYFFVDSHLVLGGEALGLSSGSVLPAPAEKAPAARRPRRTPYRTYGVLSSGRARAAVFVRDPRASMQVWSRHQGYPGDAAYLEFHKLRWPGGLRLWRVSAPGTDLGQKAPYDPAAAAARAAEHARHFAWLLDSIASEQAERKNGVVAVPFDTELFGHWWFEGPDFVQAVYRALDSAELIAPSTAGQHLASQPPQAGIRLPAGSWGANGDFGMWLSDRTAWTWERLWPLEHAFWEVAPGAVANPARHAVLEQAAREMLLAQSSDWQFIISTGAVADYAERRFLQHCEDAERLVRALASDDPSELESAGTAAAELRRRDDLFPEVLPAITVALGSRTHVRA